MKVRIPTPRLRRRRKAETEVQAAAGAPGPEEAGRAAKPDAKPGVVGAEPGKADAKAGPEGEKAKPSADPHERLDGLRAWLAQVDRKVGVRSYAGGAALVLALAAGIVGVVLALQAKDDSATKEEVRALRQEIGTIGDQAAAAAEEGVQSLTEQLESLESRVSQMQSSARTTERELEVVQDDIDDLRSQASRSGGGGSTPNIPGAGADATDIPGLPDGGGGRNDNP
jgi:uncharacterized protein HemX